MTNIKTILWASIFILIAVVIIFSIPSKAETYVKSEPQCSDILDLTDRVECELKKYDWDTQIALAVAIAESGLNPEAKNDNPKTGDYSVGIFQINLYGGMKDDRPDEETLKVPENNIAFAYELYKNGGWKHWSVCKTGKVNCS